MNIENIERVELYYEPTLLLRDKENFICEMTIQNHA